MWLRLATLGDIDPRLIIDFIVFYKGRVGRYFSFYVSHLFQAWQSFFSVKCSQEVLVVCWSFFCTLYTFLLHFSHALNLFFYISISKYAFHKKSVHPGFCVCHSYSFVVGFHFSAYAIIVIKTTFSSLLCTYDIKSKCGRHTQCSPAHHTPGRSSRIVGRTRVSWVRNQCPPICSILKTFRSEDFFQWCVLSFQVAIDVI